MGSRFGNFDLLRGLHQLVGFDKQGTGPTEVADQAVMTFPAMGAAGQVQLTGQASVAGITTADWVAIGRDTILVPPAAINAGGAVLRANGNLEVVILGLQISLFFVEPIAAGDLGGLIEVREFRQAAESTASVVFLSSFRPAAVVDSLQDRYIWSFPMWRHARMSGTAAEPVVTETAPMAASPIYVPAGSTWGLEVRFWEKDMSALRGFPAGTTLDVNGFLVTNPKGWRPAGM